MTILKGNRTTVIYTGIYIFRHMHARTHWRIHCAIYFLENEMKITKSVCVCVVEMSIVLRAFVIIIQSFFVLLNVGGFS